MGNKTNHAEPMAPEEVLLRAERFDPLPETVAFGLGIPFQPTAARPELKHTAIMRLALEMIVQQAQGGQRLHIDGTGMTAYPLIIRTAEQALRECGK